jgi:Na+/H+-dicarboxylate symporter
VPLASARLTIVLTQVGLPIEGIALILGVDWLMDMIRTAINVTGDAVVSVIVAKSEGRMDLGVYDEPDTGEVIDLHIDREAEARLAREVRPHPAE